MNYAENDLYYLVEFGGSDKKLVILHFFGSCSIFNGLYWMSFALYNYFPGCLSLYFTSLYHRIGPHVSVNTVTRFASEKPVSSFASVTMGVCWIGASQH